MPHKVDHPLMTGQASIQATGFMWAAGLSQARLRTLCPSTPSSPCSLQVQSNPKGKKKTPKTKGKKRSKPLPLVGLHLSSQNITRPWSSPDTNAKPTLQGNEKQKCGKCAPYTIYTSTKPAGVWRAGWRPPPSLTTSVQSHSPHSARKEWTQTGCPLTHTYTSWCVCQPVRARAHTHIQAHIINEMLLQLLKENLTMKL